MTTLDPIEGLVSGNDASSIPLGRRAISPRKTRREARKDAYKFTLWMIKLFKFITFVDCSDALKRRL